MSTIMVRLVPLMVLIASTSAACHGQAVVVAPNDAPLSLGSAPPSPSEVAALSYFDIWGLIDQLPAPEDEVLFLAGEAEALLERGQTLALRSEEAARQFGDEELVSEVMLARSESRGDLLEVQRICRGDRQRPSPDNDECLFLTSETLMALADMLGEVARQVSSTEVLRNPASADAATRRCWAARVRAFDRWQESTRELRLELELDDVDRAELLLNHDEAQAQLDEALAALERYERSGLDGRPQVNLIAETAQALGAAAELASVILGDADSNIAEISTLAETFGEGTVASDVVLARSLLEGISQGLRSHGDAIVSYVDRVLDAALEARNAWRSGAGEGARAADQFDRAVGVIPPVVIDFFGLDIPNMDQRLVGLRQVTTEALRACDGR